MMLMRNKMAGELNIQFKKNTNKYLLVFADFFCQELPQWAILVVFELSMQRKQ